MIRGGPPNKPTPTPRPRGNNAVKGAVMIKLGKTYKDKITGFKGVATGYVKYFTGCNQALLAPPVGKDGDMIEAQWYDEQRLVIVAKKAIILDNGKTPGFDKAAPKR